LGYHCPPPTHGIRVRMVLCKSSTDTRRQDDRLKISKEEAERAKATAKREKQRIMGQSKKNLSAQDKRDIAAQNAIIEAADHIIDGE